MSRWSTPASRVAAKTAVIGSEDDDGVLELVVIFQPVQQASTVLIQVLHHCGVLGIDLPTFEPTLVDRRDLRIGRLNWRVHRVVRQVQEPRPAIVGAQKTERFRSESIG